SSAVAWPMGLWTSGPWGRWPIRRRAGWVGWPLRGKPPLAMETTVVMMAGSAPLRGASSHEEYDAPRSGALPATSKPDRRAIAAAFGGCEIGAAVGEAPADLARAGGEAPAVGAADPLGAHLQSLERRRRHVLLGPDRLVDLVRAPARAVDGGLRVLAIVDDAREDLHVTLRLHGAAHQAEGGHRFAVLGDEARN